MADPTGITVACIVSSGVIVSAATPATPAFNVGDWPDNLPITIKCLGRIEGAGGKGGDGTVAGVNAGQAGGTALYTRYPVKLEISDGEIWGGGGGGSSGVGSLVPGMAGGGGAGYLPGTGGAPPTGGSFSPGGNGTPTAGGTGTPLGFAGASGANGGGPAQAGGGASGGAAGKAIDGISYINVTSGPGDIRGAQIN